MSGSMADILDQLKKVPSKIENNTAILVLLIAGFVVYAMYQFYSSPTSSRSQRQTETWGSVHTALDNFQYDKAADIAQRLIEKNPNYYYGYAVLGHIALERNRLKEAEGYFARAYELFPTDDNEQKLQAVQKRLAADNSK